MPITARTSKRRSASIADCRLKGRQHSARTVLSRIPGEPRVTPPVVADFRLPIGTSSAFRDHRSTRKDQVGTACWLTAERRGLIAFLQSKIGNHQSSIKCRSPLYTLSRFGTHGSSPVKFLNNLSNLEVKTSLRPSGVS
jgi:hypothetical protein